jgi:hypothetical protein
MIACLNALPSRIQSKSFEKVSSVCCQEFADGYLIEKPRPTRRAADPPSCVSWASVLTVVDRVGGGRLTPNRWAATLALVTKYLPMNCSSCGKEVRPDSVFCHHCGAKMAIEERNHLTTNGIRLGMKLAALLSFLYICLRLLVVLGPFIGAGGPPLSWYLVTGLVIFGYGVVLGVLPALVIGAITGWLIAFVIQRFRVTFSRTTACLLGLLISVGIAIVINLLLFPKKPFETEAYQTYVVIPSIIYIVVSGYMGVRLYIKNSKDNDKTIAVNAPL